MKSSVTPPTHSTSAEAYTLRTRLLGLWRRFSVRMQNMNYLHRGIVLSIDIFCSLAAGGLAYFFSCLYERRACLPSELAIALLIAGVIGGVVFQIFRFYRIIIRHASLRSLPRIILAVFLIAVILGFIIDLCTAIGQPLLIAVGYFFIACGLIIGVRVLMITTYYFVVRLSGSHAQHHGREERVFLCGDVERCIGWRGNLDNITGCRAAAIIDPDTDTRHLSTDDCRVYGRHDFDALKYDLQQHLADAIVFIDRTLLRREEARIVSWCNEAKIPIYIQHSPDHCHNGTPHPRLRPVSIEDLLERNEITINEEHIGELVRGRSILVTGAAGSIGSEIVRQLCKFAPGSITLLDSAETPLHLLRLEIEEQHSDICIHPIIADVRNRERCSAIMEQVKPAVVLHAAAYKHVPLMEEHPCEAVITNVMGTRNMADLAIEHGVAKFVMISTDKAVNPTNIMGTTKRVACMYVQSLNEAQNTTQFITTRFGNVLGSNGSVIPRFREQIERGGPVTVTHPDIVRYFMTIPEACRLVLQAATMGHGGEIFCFDMGEPVNISHLAERMIRLSGLVPGKDIAITYTGLRPGEKLYEEVLVDAEATSATTHAKIRIAHARRVPHTSISAGVDTLISLARSGDATATVRELKALVPEYHSKNSPWEKV